MVMKQLSCIKVRVALATVVFVTIGFGPRASLASAALQDNVAEALTAALDPAFGTAGKVSLALGPGAPGNGARAQALAIQQDGKIIVAGFAWQAGTSIDFAVTRFNQD